MFLEDMAVVDHSSLQMVISNHFQLLVKYLNCKLLVQIQCKDSCLDISYNQFFLLDLLNHYKYLVGITMDKLIPLDSKIPKDMLCK